MGSLQRRVAAQVVPIDLQFVHGLIDQATGEAIVKIRNPLRVSDPKAFVITLEQPGGVVVSEQDVVVAVAAPAA